MSELIQTCVHLSFGTLPLGFELEEAVSDYDVFRRFVKQLPGLWKLRQNPAVHVRNRCHKSANRVSLVLKFPKVGTDQKSS